MGFSCLLPSRSLICVSGVAAHEFLQGLFTNDLRLLQPGKSIWGCFLHHTGRVMCDAYLYQLARASEGEARILVDVHHDVADALHDHLLEMRMRKRVQIYNAGKELVVVAASPWGDRGFHAGKKGEEEEEEASSLAHKCDTFTDPRSFAFPAPLQKRIFPAAAAPSITDPVSQYETLLYISGVGEGPDVFRPSKSLPFECNTDFLRGVSFRKGCYLGQELTHRTHVTLVTRKRTVPLQLPSSSDDGTGGERRAVEKGEALLIGGQKVGEVLTVCGDVGLGLLRLRYVDAVTRTAPGLQLKGALPVSITIPSWWEEKELKKVLSPT
ncbi:transferase C1orf69 like protein, mitochondrial [Trypanosoma rangeli]|uniref:Transferase C1orf69 like protein, mitochondrial n=1 Tax=Trypanosoma rangeli TaxID=5698 RepID=A0A3R7K245_TRYRA|nr:transferase C1orf69 like protein, mitochondrial [Trypanosoma rangeli]RNE99228.1 transferase C1orf69 like protein, mitochondrial [Trypanosoma rangeli]|eukprot:RNE99228.1 transferase C1orf69 like protein, mitochondrial [Trypanosoma rangeli]